MSKLRRALAKKSVQRAVALSLVVKREQLRLNRRGRGKWASAATKLKLS